MPKDPFADDPNDPASFLDDDMGVPELTPEERARVEEDMRLVQEFAAALSPMGIDGIFLYCDDCDEEHYYEWAIMLSNIHATLNEQLPPMHEPSAAPDPSRYVPWDYALGYLDGMNHPR